MLSFRTLFTVLAVASVAAAGPVRRAEANELTDNCNGSINSCFDNGCEGTFTNPSETIGQCNAGTWAGCPCEKCGNDNGSCSENGCNGIQGICTAGTYQGCACD
ncbi:hypothetical protein F5Y14DRAFT_408734 [Nemania sp. NC0429]|nr:hypothetical protein F5Y14DRAFT_408734 [Nemania sp. NC0429]